MLRAGGGGRFGEYRVLRNVLEDVLADFLVLSDCAERSESLVVDVAIMSVAISRIHREYSRLTQGSLASLAHLLNFR